MSWDREAQFYDVLCRKLSGLQHWGRREVCSHRAASITRLDLLTARNCRSPSWPGDTLWGSYPTDGTTGITPRTSPSRRTWHKEMKFHAVLVSATDDRWRSPSNSDRLIPKGTSVPIRCMEGWLDLKAGMRKVVTVINKTAYGDRTHISILHIAISYSPNIAVKRTALLLPLRELSESIIGPESRSPNTVVHGIPQSVQANTETAPLVKPWSLLLRSFTSTYNHPIILSYSCSPS